MHFTGTIAAKIDTKGRVFLPSEFRKQIADSDSLLVLKRDIYQPCLVIYPQSVWNTEVEELLKHLNRWNKRDAMIFRQFMADAEQATLDSNGRLLVSKRFMQICSIDHSVEFVGVDDRIELWSVEQREAYFLSPEELATSMENLVTDAWKLNADAES